MRHRMVSGTGLGNPEEAILNNEGNLNKDFADEVLNTYFGKFEGFDFQITDEAVSVGIEPSYQYDPLLIVSIHKDICRSYIQRGKAWGAYGSQVVKNTKVYGNYKNNSKFVKFVDKWHKELFGK